VYNHFGPDGNYLHIYAPQFFNQRHHTPWGPAINFDGPGSETVRRFFIHNAVYWLEEYHLDGLRLDAVDAIIDDSSPDILDELAAEVHRGPGRDRSLHLILENDNNEARRLGRDEKGRPRRYTAQWNDDIHHTFHVLLTGETFGCYADYEERPHWYLRRCLAQGFGYQGESSGYRSGTLRGEPSRALPPLAFVSFLQNHDQTGNRPFGERIGSISDPDSLRAAIAMLLLAPMPPLLFMGEEFDARQPFLFFCDFGPDLATAVSKGRRRGYARFQRLDSLEGDETLPEPNDPATFRRSKLDWQSLSATPHADWLSFHRGLLALRHRQIVPRLAGIRGNAGAARQLGERGLRIEWRLGEGSTLTLLANMGNRPLAIDSSDLPEESPLYAHPPDWNPGASIDSLPAWCVLWFLRENRCEPFGS
jgi:malto-oligosyltrehalose trehalohydrolase